MDTPATPAVPLGPFSLPVLKIIIEGQGLHGLRYGDYQRYRQYCARRLQRLRKGLNFVHWELGSVLVCVCARVCVYVYISQVK